MLFLFQSCIEADCWRLGLPSNSAWGLTSDMCNYDTQRVMLKGSL